jgi:hypothetical protein
VKSGGPALGLLMVGGVRAGSDSSIEGRGAISEGARDEVGVCTARVPAPSERLEVVHGERNLAIREDVRRPMLVVEMKFWREGFAFDSRTGVGGGIVIFFRIVIGVRVV